MTHADEPPSTTTEALHRLVDKLPKHTLNAAEAFLSYLCDRHVPDGRSGKQTWAADERRGLTRRRRDREAAESGPDPDGTA